MPDAGVLPPINSASGTGGVATLQDIYNLVNGKSTTGNVTQTTNNSGSTTTGTVGTSGSTNTSLSDVVSAITGVTAGTSNNNSISNVVQNNTSTNTGSTTGKSATDQLQDIINNQSTTGFNNQSSNSSTSGFNNQATESQTAGSTTGSNNQATTGFQSQTTQQGSTGTTGSTTTNSGSTNVTTTTGKMDQAGMNAMLKSALEGNNGLASVMMGEHQAGVYSSSTQTQLANDMVSRMIGEIAKGNESQTTVQKIGGSTSSTSGVNNQVTTGNVSGTSGSNTSGTTSGTSNSNTSGSVAGTSGSNTAGSVANVSGSTVAGTSSAHTTGSTDTSGTSLNSIVGQNISSNNTSSTGSTTGTSSQNNNTTNNTTNNIGGTTTNTSQTTGPSTVTTNQNSNSTVGGVTGSGVANVVGAGLLAQAGSGLINAAGGAINNLLNGSGSMISGAASDQVAFNNPADANADMNPDLNGSVGDDINIGSDAGNIDMSGGDVGSSTGDLTGGILGDMSVEFSKGGFVNVKGYATGGSVGGNAGGDINSITDPSANDPVVAALALSKASDNPIQAPALIQAAASLGQAGQDALSQKVAAANPKTAGTLSADDLTKLKQFQSDVTNSKSQFQQAPSISLGDGRTYQVQGVQHTDEGGSYFEPTGTVTRTIDGDNDHAFGVNFDTGKESRYKIDKGGTLASSLMRDLGPIVAMVSGGMGIAGLLAAGAAGSLSAGSILQGVKGAYGLSKQFKTGGEVDGPGTTTSDSIPARLSDGEYVLRAEAVKAIGVPMLDYLNNLGNPQPRGGK